MTSNSCKVRRSRTKMVVDALLNFAVEGDIITNRANPQRNVDRNNSRVIFDYSYEKLIQTLYPDDPVKRYGDLVCDAVYERMRLIMR